MSSSKLKVSVIGLGYIGLPTAAVLASVGCEVVGVDLNQRIVEVVNRGDVHIVEPDLDILVQGEVLSGRLRAVLEVEPANVFIVAVPTPFKNGHQPDLSFVERAVRSIAPHLKVGNLVILESTSPVGTTQQVASWLARERPDLTFPSAADSVADVQLAYCPERVLPGNIVSELVQNDRIIGGVTPRCSAQARQLYELFVRGQCIETDVRTAEMTKLTENAFRDVNIAFANELSLICDELDINVWELIALANRHPRVNILNPGPGVGGHCIAVDPWFIVDSAPSSANLIRTARQVNDGKPKWVLSQIEKAIDTCKVQHGRDAVVACLGLAFKADIDDLRESPSVAIVEELAGLNLCARLLVVEPFLDALPPELIKPSKVELLDLEVALSAADVVVLLVDHSQFKNIDRTLLRGKDIIDTRGIWR